MRLVVGLEITDQVAGRVARYASASNPIGEAPIAGLYSSAMFGYSEKASCF
jgi:hypothetical protein